MSTNKNPFEIRTDLLSMAKDYMDRQQDIAMKLSLDAMDRMIESGKATAEVLEQLKPKMYSIDELKQVAEQMYSFVAPITSGPQNLNESKKK